MVLPLHDILIWILGAVAAASNSVAVDGDCPEGMVHVEGDYCPDVKAECLRWVDPPGTHFSHLRCAEFKRPATCKAPKRRVSYCIDRDEAVGEGELLPTVHVSFTRAEQLCAARGARLCTEDEWQFACEGEEMLPYPYGFERDASACNFDRTDLGRPEEGLTDHRAMPGGYPQCVSPFGVRDLVGNVDEWTRRKSGRPPLSGALHGGWWLPGRNSCRAATYGHLDNYGGPQVGYRCCANRD